MYRKHYIDKVTVLIDDKLIFYDSIRSYYDTLEKELIGGGDDREVTYNHTIGYYHLKIKVNDTLRVNQRRYFDKEGRVWILIGAFMKREEGENYRNVIIDNSVDTVKVVFSEYVDGDL